MSQTLDASAGTSARAAVLRGAGGDFKLEDISIEAPRHGEILVEIAATGMCHTDLSVRDQLLPVPLPVVLGHEGAGIVRAIGEGVTKVRPGDPVVLSYLSCGGCRNCSGGRPTYCETMFPLNFAGARADGSSPLRAGDGSRIGGSFFGQSSFASHALVSERNVVRVPGDVDLTLLGPLGCGLQTGAGAVINVLKPGPGASLVVFGVGSVGLSAVMAARAIGVTSIIAVDVNPVRLDLARELGASHAIDGAQEDVVARLAALTGRGADFTLETTAVPSVLRTAVDCLALPGVCGVVGAAAMGTEVAIDMSQMLGRTMVGIIEGDSVPDVFIPYLIDLYRAGRFPIDRLVTRYALADINAAAADSAAGRVIKPVLVP